MAYMKGEGLQLSSIDLLALPQVIIEAGLEMDFSSVIYALILKGGHKMDFSTAI